METPDFFRARIDAMINMNDPRAVLARRLPWDQIDSAVAAKFERQERAGQILEGHDMFGPTLTASTDDVGERVADPALQREVACGERAVTLCASR